MIVPYLQKRPFLLYLLVIPVLFFLTKILLGNYYEVYEFIFPATFSGKLMGGAPGNIFYPIAHIGLANLYTAFYSFFPNVTWYDYVMGFFMALSTTVIFSAIHSALRYKFRFWQIVLFNVLVFFLFMADNILNWNYTRSAFTVCIAAFAWFSLVLQHEQKSSNRALSFVLCSLLFTVGVSIRPEAGTLMFILITAYLYFLKGATKDFFLKLLPFLVPVVIVSGTVFFERAFSEEFYKQLDPVTEYQIALGKVVGVSEMKNPVDSMKYLALNAGIVNDPQEINEEFVQRVVVNKRLLQFDLDLLQRAQNLIFENLIPYKHNLFFILLLVICGIWLLSGNKQMLLRYFLFQVSFWLLLFAIAFFMTLESRLMSPLLFFYFVINMAFLLAKGLVVFMNERRFVFVGFTVALAIIVVVNIVYLKDVGDVYEKKILDNERSYKQLQSVAKGKLLVPDASGLMIILSNFIPFRNPDLSAFERVFLIDIETLSLTEAYSNYLDGNCRCDSKNLAAFFDYLYNHKNKVVFAGEMERIKLFESYLRIVHSRNYSFAAQQQISASHSGKKNAVMFFTLN